MYILVILILHSFGLTPFGHHPQYTLVDSVEKAAISVYLDKQNNISVEPDIKQYKLYKLILVDKKLITEEVPIPEIFFKPPK